MHRLALIFATLIATVPAAEAQYRPRIDVPIVLGGENRVDACGGSGQVVGLDPNGDGFLSVRSGPGGRDFHEIDRLFNGNAVYICGQNGPWLAVVYPGGEPRCGVNTPWPIRQPYTGPCRQGWIHSQYVRATAG